MKKTLSPISKRPRPPAPLVAATGVAAVGVVMLVTTQTPPPPSPNRSPERELRVSPSPLAGEGAAPAAGEGSTSATGVPPVISSFSSLPSPDLSGPAWQVITLTGFDADGEPVAQDFDFHPLARFDIWQSGPGDTNLDGVVDLADLNLVLERMGTDYRDTEPGGPTP